MSGWYLAGKQGLLSRAISPDAGVCVIGVNDEYTFDETHADINLFTPYILLPELQLAGLSYTNGILRAANPSWTAAGAGISDRSLNLKAVVIYFKEVGATTLLAYIDSASAGLPQTLSGVDILGKWSANGILKL